MWREAEPRKASRDRSALVADLDRYGHTGDPTTRFAAPGEEALGELTP